ncbi:hypothetical protein Lesp02_83100 [Lentzea sp. NBRC 105346]|uniref:hypothetical protein n=1 Tax=Lentzea sp. NBRC 105346 TaxID=3032205 RepID=UPI0024A07E66|nr:hypothetical protein [Lentzea sp. NBRC 105346]GLZ36123.1 hypothetical protein Lesp02_83100 [Lentzea sp. NBRC 105346]
MTEPAGKEYAVAVKELVDTEAKRRDSLESRAVAVVSVSGTLLTLLLALSAATRGKDVQLVGGGRAFVVVSVLVFVVAAAAAIGVYAPRVATTIDVGRLRDEVRAHWSDDSGWGLKRVTGERLHQLDELQRTNDTKGKWLLGAVVAQFAGVVLVAVAVAMTLTG